MIIIKFPQRAQKINQPKMVLPIGNDEFNARVERMSRYLDGIIKAGEVLFRDNRDMAETLDRIDYFSLSVLGEALELNSKCACGRGSV